MVAHSVIPAFGRLKQEDQFNTNLDCTARPISHYLEIPSNPHGLQSPTRELQGFLLLHTLHGHTRPTLPTPALCPTPSTETVRC